MHAKEKDVLLLSLDYATQILMATPKFEIVKSKLGDDWKMRFSIDS